MKRVDFLPPDPIDAHLSRWFKNWVAAVQPPRAGREALMLRIALRQERASVSDRMLTFLRWSLENLLLNPFDLVCEPVLYSSEIDRNPVRFHQEHGPTLVVRSMSQISLPFGIGLFNLVP
ncbi:MAG: hypothetical protein P1P76_00945 [Anaerolineales bacterium]|nr:hypothetical protein [Anaerolineales bacterium]